MRRINPDRLSIGARFRGAIVDAAGRTLLRAGHPITAAMIDFLRSGPGAAIAMNESAPTLSREETALVAASSERRQTLRRRWAVRAGLRRSAQAVVNARRARWSRLELRIPAIVPASVPNPELSRVTSPALTRESDESIALERAERTGVLRRVLARLADGEAAGAGALNELVEELIDRCRRSHGLFAAASTAGAAGGLEGACPRADSLADHAYTTAALCVGIAARLGWSCENVRAAGLAGLLADSGMALVPMPVRSSMRPLTEIELNAVRRHTAYSALFAQCVAASAGPGAVPETVQLAVYQHHEREDGSGYPEGLRSGRIHDIAKVVAVADAFAGAIEPRAHRPAAPAPAALAEIVRQANSGALDKRAARALVDLCNARPARPHVQVPTAHAATAA